jgi:hypothetical protein
MSFIDGSRLNALLRRLASPSFRSSTQKTRVRSVSRDKTELTPGAPNLLDAEPGNYQTKKKSEKRLSAELMSIKLV